MAYLGFDKNRLKEAMGDMTAIELAEKLGCSKSSISMYLSGQQEPSKMAIQLISLILGVNPAWLCGLDVEKRSNAKIISVNERPSEKAKKFAELFGRLSDDQQNLVIAQLEGILKMK